MALRLDASTQEPADDRNMLLSALPCQPSAARQRRPLLSLRSRLLLLVVASVLPFVCMTAIREYSDFRADRRQIDNSLLMIARSTAVAVERELQLRISSLESLATSPALQAGNLAAFDEQANAFLARQPTGTILSLSTPDAPLPRLYGGRPGSQAAAQFRDDHTTGHDVFQTGRPAVTDLHLGTNGQPRFSVDVPVVVDGKVAYDLALHLLPNVMTDLIARQQLPSTTVLAIIDTSGTIVARAASRTDRIGSRIVPGLWDAVQAHTEGITLAPTLEGLPAVAAYTHIAPFGWAITVGAPEAIVFGPMHTAAIQLTLISLIAFSVALVLAMFAARGITRPIEQLRRLAAHEETVSHAETGLPETDVVAAALGQASVERRAAANALAESETRFRALFERSPNGTILLDPDTMQVIDSNEVAAATGGCSIEEFRRCKLTDFAQQTSSGQIQAICRAVIGGTSLRYETRFFGRDGPRDLLVAAAPVQVAGRTLVLLNQIDVTDLRKAELGLRINEERLELAREGASLGIWDYDVVNRKLTWSDHQWYLHGLEPRAEGPDISIWSRTIHPAGLLRARQELRKALRIEGHRYTTEYSVVLPDGSFRRLLARGQTIRNAKGEAIRMVGINMDVTARYEAEMARDRLIAMLERERSRLAEIIEVLPVGVGIVDATGRVTLGNAVMNRLNGPVLQSMSATPRGQWIGFDAGGNLIAPDDYPVRRALRLGETTFPGIEFRYQDSDGSQTWFRIASLPLRWENGQVAEVLGIFQSIDAEKRLLDIQQQINARLEQRVHEEISAREAAQQRAAHAERMHALGQIAGGIAHDFNNVLQAVSGGAALIERRPADAARVLRHSRMVLDAARRGAAITSRLLAFSRRGDLRAQSIDPAGLLADMAEVLSHTLGGSVICQVHAAPGLPALSADRGQLETVLVNLATNARDAMPSGGTLTMAADSETVAADAAHPCGLAAGSYLRIIVSDTGVGMEQSVLARVTEPFFTTKEPGKGTGLGLAMAKGFVEQSGGSLAIDSIVGHGTRITLWLPATTQPVHNPDELAAEPAGVTAEARVLLVDDDAIVRDVLQLSLEDCGYVVYAAGGGQAALACMQAADRVDIVVSDMTMPGMDGLTLIRSLQQLQPNLPAILLTGYAGDGAALAVGGAIKGTFSLLRKPISGAQLADRITALLQHDRLERNVQSA